ncbi:MAG: DUF6531 domain-containing protein [Deltaproteobacteria bacterium]|nr:DUF6531 domain-containing protein [Deltaproteobacteria bacterium]
MTVPLPADYRNIQLIDPESCALPFPLPGDCGTVATGGIDFAPLVVKTIPAGVMFDTLLGDTVNTKYTVQVSVDGLSPVDFNLSTEGVRPAGEYLPPSLLIRHMAIVNNDGQLVNSAPAGEMLGANLTAQVFLLSDEYSMGPVYGCVKYDNSGNSYNTDCRDIISSGKVKIEPVTNATVSFNPVLPAGGDQVVGATLNAGSGRYEASYQTASLAAVNTIEASGEALVDVPVVYYNSDENKAITTAYETTAESLPTQAVTLKLGQKALFDEATGSPVIKGAEEKAVYRAYGVKLGKLDLTTEVILLNEAGYNVWDDLFSYRIEPVDYEAAAAAIDMYEIDETGERRLMGVIQSGTSGDVQTVLTSGAARFDTSKTYEAQVVLNRGSAIEMKGELVEIRVVDEDRFSGAVDLERVHHLSRFDVGAALALQTDSFQIFDFSLAKDSNVTIRLLDEKMVEKDVLIDKTLLLAGDHMFLIDFASINKAGFSPGSAPRFNVLLEMSAADGSEDSWRVHPGRMRGRTDGKMLGQTIVHDVLIQDGSLNLSRQDMAFGGRGPQLAFSRSYNNQGSPAAFNPLGNGWSHSLDMKLWPLSTATHVGGLPGWVVGLKGKYFEESDIPVEIVSLNMVSVNGTVFQKNALGGWYAERGRHGSLTEETNTFVYRAKDGTKYRYPATAWRKPSQVESIEDRNGNMMIFSYDAMGRLERVADAVGRTLLLEYGYFRGMGFIENSRLFSVTGPDGVKVAFTYDSEGNLVKAARGERMETYEYRREPAIAGAEFNLVKSTDTNGYSYEYDYYGANEVDSNLRTFTKYLKSQDVVKAVRYPDSNAAFFLYDVAGGNKRVVTDLAGKDTVYTLNFYGNPLTIEEPLGRTTHMTWSIDEGKPDNVMTSRTDPLGKVTLYEYDGKGNISKETDPYSNSIVTSWNQEFSLPESRTDRNGVAESWTYNTRGNLTNYTDGDGNSVSYSYFATGERRSMTDGRSNTTNYTYDANGNPNTVTGPEGSVTDYDHDIRGRRIALTDPRGNRTEYTYDALDQPDQVIYPNITDYSLPAGSTNIVDYNYDAVGNLLSETNRNGLTLNYSYTARNQVASISRSSSGTRSFVYDANGNLTSETDWGGIATAHTYDALNRRITTTNRLAHTMSMTYDLTDNLKSLTDYEGRVTTYNYDDLGRLTETIQPALASQAAGTIINTYYNEADAEKNLKSITDQEGNVIQFAYNGRYLKTSQTNALGDVSSFAYDAAGNLISQTDEEGKVTSFEYDKQNRRTKVIQPGGIETGYAYDKSGNMTSLTDPLGRVTSTAYDAWNRPWQVTDADGYVSATWYDGEGKEVRVIDGNGNVKRFVRNSLGLVEKAIDAELKSTLYTYDLNSNVTTVTDARGTVTATTYDAEDRPTSVVEADGTAVARTKTVLYDKMGNAVETTDYKGNITKTAYNALNLPETVTDANNNATTTEYDRRGKVVSVTDRRNNKTTFEYDALGREVKVTDALGQFTQKTYDKVGNVKSLTDKRGIITENTYDDLYRLINTKRAGITLVTNEYDNAGNVTATTDAEGNRTGYDYNGRNLLIASIYADTTTESRTYDGVGNVLTVTDEEGKVTTYTYDKENRETSVTFAGETTSKEYDAVGNLTLITKPLGNTKAMVYDVLNRMTEVSEGGLVTKYAYDKNSNVTFQMDALGRRIKYEYDALNRKVKHIQPGNITTTYGYDAEGNMTAMTDAKGQSFSYVYDKINRQTEASYPDIATPYMTPLKTVTAYDANNNVITVTESKRDVDGNTVTDLTENVYDDFDRLTSSTQRGVAINYAYDNNGNRTSVSTATGTTAYTYDSRNRIETATADTLVTSYGYYVDGKKDTVTYPNGTDVKYTYHPTNRVASIVNKVTADSSVISSYAYEYDSNGNRTSQVEVQNGVTETTSYSYDDLDRMADYTVTDGTDTTLTTYTFEAYNRKTEDISTNGTATASKTYTYDALDRLARVVDSVKGKTISYSYDLNGNMISRIDSLDSAAKMQFEYDALNRLVKTMQVSVVKGLYDYNAGGLRVRHRLSERGDVDYFYDGNSVIEERNAVDSSLLAHYRYADRLLSLNTGAATQYYHHDALGSTVNLTDSVGAVQVSYSLDPWGTIRNQTGSSINRQIFTGQELDEKTGLIYFGARYYDSETARFISQDTYLGEYGTPPSLHRYLFAYSNPTVYIDLLGYASELPPVSEYNYTGYTPEGYIYSQYQEASRGYMNPENALLDRGVYFLLTVATMPVALVEEHVGRPLLNAPNTTYNSAVQAGERSARMGLRIEEEEYLLAVEEGLHVVKHSAEGFDAAAALFVPAAEIARAKSLKPKNSGPEITAEPRNSTNKTESFVRKEIEQVENTVENVATKKSDIPVKYDPEFAAQQILNHKPVTPAGRQITPHAAGRMVNPPKGRNPISATEVDYIVDSADKIKKITDHPEGPTITLQNTKMQGKPQVVVDAETGRRIVTTINPKRKR